MIKEKIEFIRKRHISLMPKFMKDFDRQLNTTDLPSEINFKKGDYIYEWIKIFDSSIAHDIDNRKQLISQYMRFNVLELKQAFKWSLDHFAELDLGENMKWIDFSIKALIAIEAEKWDTAAREKLIHDYIRQTRWFDY